MICERVTLATIISQREKTSSITQEVPAWLAVSLHYRFQYLRPRQHYQCKSRYRHDSLVREDADHAPPERSVTIRTGQTGGQGLEGSC